MTPCPQCQRPLTPGASDCPACGYVLGKVDVPDEQGPKGIGGWLILPLIGLIVSPLRIIYSMYTDLLPFLSARAWGALTNPGSPAYHPLWSSLIVFELISNVAIVIFGLWVLVSFLSKSSSTPKLFIVWISLFIVLQLIDLLLGGQIPAVAQHIEPKAFSDLFRAIIAAAIWVPYFLKSKRVANTFRN